MKTQYPAWLAGKPHTGGEDLVVYNKYTQEKACTVPLATPDILDQAITLPGVHRRSSVASALWLPQPP